MTEISRPRCKKRIKGIPSLFVKIFLWFWVAMALVSFASLLSAIATESHPFLAVRWLRFLVPPPGDGHPAPDPGSPRGRWISAAGSILRLSGEAAAEIYEREGEPGLSNYADRLEQAGHMRVFLFKGGEHLTSNPLPEGITAPDEQAGNAPGIRRRGDSILISVPVAGPSNDRYIYLVQLSRRHIPGRERDLPVMNLLILLLTAGGVCYWLARYITTPIRKLRTATRRLADGDLTVRIGSASGRRNDEIADLGKDFDLMAERIESLMQTQKRLLRDISHEFRSPLTRLTIALEIARTRGKEEASRAFDRIEREAGRLNELIGQLLTLARIESGAEAAKYEPIELSQLLEGVAADADFEARQRGCGVRITASEHCIVLGAEDLLRSAIENIVRNALYYTAQGTEVLISLGRAGSENGVHALLRVHDQGPGVPEEVLVDLFYPFYRVGDARDRKQGGSGLGLAITERAVRVHGGTVKAANSPEGGLIVSIYIPVM